MEVAIEVTEGGMGSEMEGGPRPMRSHSSPIGGESLCGSDGGWSRFGGSISRGRTGALRIRLICRNSAAEP